MARWPIVRTWEVVAGMGVQHQVPSNELLKYRVCVFLGAAGLGKTCELSQLADLERQGGQAVRVERLAILGQTAEGLSSKLNGLADAGFPSPVLYLDALDEVMVPVRNVSAVVQEWTRTRLATTKQALRMSCRSTVWPVGVEAALREVYGTDDFAVARLRPLSMEDVETIAASDGIDGRRFVDSIESVGAVELARLPLTLTMLLRLFRADGALPRRRRDLFEGGVALLAEEREERLELGTTAQVPLPDIIDAAERLALYGVLTGREVVDLGDEPTPSTLGRIDLAVLQDGSRQLSVDLVSAVGRCGLCDREGPRGFRFAHRQLAEFLAGRRLARLPLHQVTALLRAGTNAGSGVSGPLRETAAFSALHSDDVAEWVTNHDPEVIGLSDVTDDALRRRATLNLLDKYRRHELTGFRIGSDGLEPSGFEYDGAEDDLRPVLRERGEEAEDVLDGAVSLIRAWKLVSMGEDLAELAIDATAPRHARELAGWALTEFGTVSARRRLLPLIDDRSDDEDGDLRGVALLCNWPDGLSTEELLVAISRRRADGYYGAYEHFLDKLDREEFAARGHALAGLRWACKYVGDDNPFDAQGRIARRIAVAALDDLDEPGVPEATVDLMLKAARAYARSPFSLPLDRDSVGDASAVPEMLVADHPEMRRRLIDLLTSRASTELGVLCAIEGRPRLVGSDDCPWLLRRAVSPDIPMSQRKNYVQLVRFLPWDASVSGVEAWLAVRTIEPIASMMPIPLITELGSDAALQARNVHERMKQHAAQRVRPKLVPSPRERVEQILRRSETGSPQAFLSLCREVTLEEDSTHYGFEQILTRTPGWIKADDGTRARIVDAAKRYLASAAGEVGRCRTEALDSILVGPMQAVLLIFEIDRTWLQSQPDAWWQHWAWYFLRELRPWMSGEPAGMKMALLQLIHERAPADVRGAIVDLTTSNERGARDLLGSLLRAMSGIPDPALDSALGALMAKGHLVDDRVGEVADYLLAHAGDAAGATLMPLLDVDTDGKSDAMLVGVAGALLQARMADSWKGVSELLRRRRDLAERVLGSFAYEWLAGSGATLKVRDPGRLSSRQAAELLELLFEVFPPRSDPRRHGAFQIEADDSARRLRDQVLGSLAEGVDIEAVNALRGLESRFGAEYPWLRHSRVRAERAHRSSYRQPLPLPAIARLLSDRRGYLIGSGRDALDGIVEAIKQYASRLRCESPSDIEDLWNRVPKAPPRPKDEGRISDKVCQAIRDYFERYAIGAEREVEISRRIVSSASGGRSGSEIDVLVRAPSATTRLGERILVPVEVKLAHNPEARTAMRDQLCDRYMSELGTDLGVYVVGWMGRPIKQAWRRPLWRTAAEAQKELDEEARVLMAESPEGRDIRVIVLDASLHNPGVRVPTKAQLRRGGKTSDVNARTSHTTVQWKGGGRAKSSSPVAGRVSKTRRRPRRT